MSKRVGLLDFMQALITRFQSDKVPQIGAQLAYYLLLSLFPLFIFILSVLSFTPLADGNNLTRMLSGMPQASAALLEPVLRDIIASRSGSILGLSLLLSLWSGSNGINNLIQAMDAAYDIENARKQWLRRLVSVGYTIILVLVIVLALGIQVFGDQLIHSIIGRHPNFQALYSAWKVLQFLLPLVIISLSLAALYKWGPGFPQNLFVRYREALLGASVAALLWSIASYGFGIYVDQFANYSKTYGSLGGVIVLMLWLYLSSVIIMLGAEITANYIDLYQGGLQRQVIAAILEDPQAAAEAGTEMIFDQEKTAVARPMALELVVPAKSVPIYRRSALYLGALIGGVLGWLARKLSQ